MSISPLGKAVIKTQAAEAQREADQRDYEEMIREINNRHMTPFERASTIGSMCQLPEKEKK